MNVLSLFDEISCGQLALNCANISYENYFSSEIDKHAIKITQANYPNTIQLGDVSIIDVNGLPNIDLLLGGSPCQSFSLAGNNKGFAGKSGLIEHYFNIFDKLKPKYFLLENVNMKKEWVDIISKRMGVEPIKINSALVCAQNRVRLYWTNIEIDSIIDRNVLLDNIVETQIDEKYYLNGVQTKKIFNKIDFTNIPSRLFAIDLYNKKIKTDNKCQTLVHPCHGGLRLYDNGRIRQFTPTEWERLQTIPDGYTDKGVSKTNRCAAIGNGWTIDVISHIFKNLQRNFNL